MDARAWSWRTVMISAAVFLMASTMIITMEARPLADQEIEFEEGEVVDCVDIYKQPAFHHPLLKDHEIITAPSFFPKMGKIANPSPTLQNNKECPEGTIPIRRMQNSDLIYAKSFDSHERRDAVISQTVERAGLIARGGHVGATGKFNVWAVSVEKNEWSHADVELSDDSQKSFIEGGWLVHPGLFGDNKTHLYSYWTADGYGNTGCYNLLCPGFIQISKKVALGAAITPLSVYGGHQFEMKITIYKDEGKMVWWLVVQEEPVGYWPISIFVNNNFAEATTIKWTGSIVNANNGGRHTTTDMGSGHFPGEGWEKAAYIAEMQVMKDPEEGFDYPKPSWYFEFAEKPECYNIKLGDDGHSIYYGGPGYGADGC